VLTQKVEEKGKKENKKTYQWKGRESKDKFKVIVVSSRGKSNLQNMCYLQYISEENGTVF
jgi:hypothetical protein